MPTWSAAAEADTGLSIPSLRVDGGMSANPTFVQALANATGKPVEVAPVVEATTLGAAFLAGVATGVWPDLATTSADSQAEGDRRTRPASSTGPDGRRRCRGPRHGFLSSRPSTSRLPLRCPRSHSPTLSSKPTSTGWNPDRIARAWAELMQRLGYSRYVAQGGDWGSPISSAMARQAPAGLLGID